MSTQPTLFPLPPATPPAPVPLFPAAAYEAALGAQVVAELKKARPRQYADHGVLTDRFIINPGAMAYWLHHWFKLNILIPDNARRVQADPLAETIIVRRTAYSIPHWCYLATIDPADPRPRRWPGIPKPQE